MEIVEAPRTIPLTPVEKLQLENLALKFQLLSTQMRLMEYERNAAFMEICKAHDAPEGTRVDLQEGVLIVEQKV